MSGKSIKPRYVIVHSSASTTGDCAWIDKLHQDRGFAKIGYHLVILNGRRKAGAQYDPDLDGVIEFGRAFDLTRKTAEMGAHCKTFIDPATGERSEGFNDRSVGVCMIGDGTFTDRQFEELLAVVEGWIAQSGFDIPVENVLGHYETASGAYQGKTCPQFDVKDLRAALRRVGSAASSGKQKTKTEKRGGRMADYQGLSKGVKTSEFWMSVVGIVLNVVLSLFGKNSPETAAAITGLGGFYAASRGLAKKGG